MAKKAEEKATLVASELHTPFPSADSDQAWRSYFQAILPGVMARDAQGDNNFKDDQTRVEHAARLASQAAKVETERIAANKKAADKAREDAERAAEEAALNQ